MGAGIVLNVAVLGFFKYARLLPALQGIELDAPGISFFTFTQIAFLVETYRRNIVPMGMSEYGLYVSFFPKLMQGPIMRLTAPKPVTAYPAKTKTLHIAVHRIAHRPLCCRSHVPHGNTVSYDIKKLGGPTGRTYTCRRWRQVRDLMIA